MPPAQKPNKNRLLVFVDAHPRVGWYVAVLSTLNVALNLADLLK